MGDDAGGREPSERRPPGLRHRMRYRFDNLLARGTSASLVWLGIVTVAAVVVCSLALVVADATLAGSENGGWLEDVWQSLLRVMDTGTMANDEGWGPRLVALAITIFGVLVAGTLIGIIAAGVEDRIDRMRRGRSVVIESDHVVVLGASDRLPVLLQQLVLASERGKRGGTIVVLADLDPAEIHAVAQGAADRAGRTKIVYRSGDPTDPDDLALVRLQKARSVIVLSDQRSDRAAVETVLAIDAELGRFEGLTVVVELLHADTMRRLHRAYGSSIHPIVTAEAVARTVAFALRQRGVSRVVDELLDFRGSDLHVVEHPDAVGSTFGGLVRSWANARPVGLRRADGTVVLDPDLDMRVGPDDQIVAIADDINAIEVTEPAGELPTSARVDRSDHSRADAGSAPEHLVVIGWSDLGAHILAGWAASAAPSSTVDVVVDERWGDPDALALPDLETTTISCTVVDDVITDAIARQPTTLVIFGRPGSDPEADIETILDLTALQRELATRATSPPRIVVELRDATHRALVDLTGPDDLIISDAMGSQFLAQLADQPDRRDVLLELYAASGASLRLLPSRDLDLAGEHSVRDIVDRGLTRGLLVLGWRRAPDRAGDVTLNPHLLSRVELDPGDELVVIG